MKLKLLLLILLFSACNSSKKNIVITDNHNSKNSLDWTGTYQGIIPCADCIGQETKLVLNQDKTYSISTIYQGKSEEVFEEKGAFEWNDKGNSITLHKNEKPSLNHQYLVIENALLKLDRQGNEIKGDLKDKYRLTKNNSSSYNLKPNEHIYWINSRKVKCTGVNSMMCMQVQKKETADTGNWQLFYNSIKGFEFEEGYIYKLIVREIEQPKNEVPADFSSTTYELVEIVEKNFDNSLKLNDIWALISVNGEKINLKDLGRNPQLELNLKENRVMGNNGCNNFTGEIKIVNSKYLEFEKVAETRMACPNMKLSNQINNSIQQVKAYQLNNLQLVLYNSNGKELLRYKKID